jgi:hypothetical protein
MAIKVNKARELLPEWYGYKQNLQTMLCLYPTNNEKPLVELKSLNGWLN